MALCASGHQNIIEGSKRASTSKETEIQLTDVARGSLDELLGDYEIFLAERQSIPWSRHSQESIAFTKLMLPEFYQSDDSLHDYWVHYHEARKPFAPWFEHPDCTVVANAMVVLLQRTMAMLAGQLKHQGEAFLHEGGFKERMYHCRSEVRDQQSAEPNAPACPHCQSPMRKRFPRRGSENQQPFWGCSNYPNCKGTRPFSD